jgi:hypothetical protein
MLINTPKLPEPLPQNNDYKVDIGGHLWTYRDIQD